MAPRSLTIVVLTDLAARARQIQVSQRMVAGILVGSTVALLTIAYLVFHYIVFQVDRDELGRLRQTVKEQEVLAKKMGVLERELNRLRSVDHQIRRLAGMEAGPVAENTMGIGGGTVELQQALTAEEQAAQRRLMQQLYEDLERLEREVALRAESLEALTAYLAEQKDRLAATPSIWPTKGYLSSKFGPRTSPFTGHRQMHSGVDIAAPRGTPILAAADGVVTFSGKMSGYGNVIVVTHGFGFKSFYGHNHENKVEKGQRVKRGQLIGTVGNSGYSTGSHVHYEVLVKDAPVNPLKYILDEDRRVEVIRGQ